MRSNVSGIGELVERLERLSERAEDVVADTRRLTLLDDGQTVDMGLAGRATLTPFSLGQIAERADVPVKYARRLVADYPALAAETFNAIWAQEPRDTMLRTLRPESGDGPSTLRAALSGSYLPVDGIDVVRAVTPALTRLAQSGTGVDPTRISLTDHRLEIELTSPRLRGDVRVGDTVQAGIVLRTGETGQAAVSVAQTVFRLACLNGMTLSNVVRRAHLGGKLVDGISVAKLSRSTLDVTRQAILAVIADAVPALLSEEAFSAALGKLRAAAEDRVYVAPAVAVATLARRAGLTDGERDAIADAFGASGDYTRYGLSQAVTFAAHALADPSSPDSMDRQGDLNALGGTVIELLPEDWRVIAGDRPVIGVGLPALAVA